jgi:hypothetical protein
VAVDGFQHVQGIFNDPIKSQGCAHVVGGGNGDMDRWNIHTLDWDGNAWFKGKIETEHNIPNKVLFNNCICPKYLGKFWGCLSF